MFSESQRGRRARDPQRRRRDHRRPAAFTDLDEDLRQSLRRIAEDPFIPVKDSVRGFVYEVETGRLREVK